MTPHEDDLVRLLHVSRNLVPPERLDESVQEIFQAASRHNKAAGITGSLLVTPTTFAQVLEGPRGAVARMHAQVVRDRRNTDVALLAERDVPARNFDSWSVTYAPEGRDVAVRIDIAEAGQPSAVVEDTPETVLGRLISVAIDA